MYNILVLGISGNVSFGILKALKYVRIECRIIGGCVNIGTASDLWCDEVIESPYADDPDFIPWLIHVCNQKEIDIFLTGVEEILYAVSKNIDRLKNGTHTVFIVSDFRMLEIGQNKLLTCQWLKEHGFNYPKYALSQDKNSVWDLCEDVGFPLIAKPIKGKGSHGLKLIKSMTDLRKICNMENMIVQQHIGNKDSEYTVGCYLCRDGFVVKPIIMQRWLNNGATWKVRVIENSLIEQDAVRICEAFKPTGPMNIQLRLDQNGIPIPFELNVRFSGSTPMRTHFGFNDVEAVISEYLENKPVCDLFNIRIGEAFRYINEIYKVTGRDNPVVDKTPEF